jgi:hypothetical protein
MFWKSFLVAFLLDNKKHFYQSKKNNSIIPMCESSINNLWKKSVRLSDGFDHTFNETETQTFDNEMLLMKIVENSKKMALLKTLENKDISNDVKILFIDEYKKNNESKIPTVNIKGGGLFKDWDNI